MSHINHSLLNVAAPSLSIQIVFTDAMRKSARNWRVARISADLDSEVDGIFISIVVDRSCVINSRFQCHIIDCYGSLHTHHKKLYLQILPPFSATVLFDIYWISVQPKKGRRYFTNHLNVPLLFVSVCETTHNFIL